MEKHLRTILSSPCPVILNIDDVSRLNIAPSHDHFLDLIAQHSLGLPIDFMKDGYDYSGINKNLESSEDEAESFYTTMTLLAKGVSIRVRNYQSYNDHALTLCKILEAVCAKSVRANIYMTPARMNAMPPHWDTHDVLIIQMNGKKRWKIWNPPCGRNASTLPHASKSYELVTYAISSLPIHEVVLHKNEGLFIPVGFIHAAFAEQNFSTHCTFGLL